MFLNPIYKDIFFTKSSFLFFLCLLLYRYIDFSVAGLQYLFEVSLFETFFGLYSLSIIFLFLTSLMIPLCLLFHWNNGKGQQEQFFFLILIFISFLLLLVFFILELFFFFYSIFFILFIFFFRFFYHIKMNDFKDQRKRKNLFYFFFFLSTMFFFLKYNYLFIFPFDNVSYSLNISFLLFYFLFNFFIIYFLLELNYYGRYLFFQFLIFFFFYFNTSFLLSFDKYFFLFLYLHQSDEFICIFLNNINNINNINIFDWFHNITNNKDFDYNIILVDDHTISIPKDHVNDHVNTSICKMVKGSPNKVVRLSSTEIKKSLCFTSSDFKKDSLDLSVKDHEKIQEICSKNKLTFVKPDGIKNAYIYVKSIKNGTPDQIEKPIMKWLFHEKIHSWYHHMKMKESIFFKDKLDGVKYLDLGNKKTMKLFSASQESVLSLMNYLKFHNPVPGFVCIPTHREETIYFQVPIDFFIVKEDAFYFFLDTKRVDDFIKHSDECTFQYFKEKFIITYECKTTTTRKLIKPNALDHLMVELNYPQSTPLHINNSINNDFQKSIDFVNVLDSSDKVNYVKNKSIEGDIIYFQQAKKLFTTSQIYGFTKEAGIPFHLKGGVTSSLIELAADRAFKDQFDFHDSIDYVVHCEHPNSDCKWPKEVNKLFNVIYSDRPKYHNRMSFFKDVVCHSYFRNKEGCLDVTKFSNFFSNKKSLDAVQFTYYLNPKIPLEKQEIIRNNAMKFLYKYTTFFLNK